MELFDNSGMLTYLKKLRTPFRRPLNLALLTLILLGGTANAYSAPKTVLVLGDSLSAEYGLVRGSGWVALMEQRLQAQKIDANVINASISGETTSGGRTRLPALLTKYRPSVVVVELGANDGLRGLPLAATTANLRAIGSAAKAANAKVLLIGMRMPPNYGSTYANQFFAVFGKVAADIKVPLVPFMLEGIGDQPALFQADRLHPLAAAHPIILQNIWPQLLPIIHAK